MHGNVTPQFGRPLQFHQYTDTSAVYVGGYAGRLAGRLQHTKTPHSDVLAQLNDQATPRLVHRGVPWQGGSQQRLQRVGLRREHVRSELVAERRKDFVARHEVGLAVQLHHGARAICTLADKDSPLGGYPVGLAVGARQAGHAHVFDGSLQVAAGLLQGALAIHHAGAGAAPEFPDAVRAYRHRRALS